MSGTVSTDLVAWLTQILDEDEAAAKAVPEPPEWHVGDESDPWAGWDRDMVYCWPPEFRTPYEQDKHWRGMQLPHAETASFVSMHDPAAVLADIAAKRAIIALHHGKPEAYHAGACNECGTWTWTEDIDRPGKRVVPVNRPLPCTTLRLLASAYADRPSYNESWRP